MSKPRSAFGAVDQVITKAVSKNNLTPAQVGKALDDQLMSMVYNAKKKEKISKRELTRLQRCNSIKPIMSPHLEEQVLAAVAQYTNMHKWVEWGMKYFRVQGACVLLKGPPGCGKTVIARYLASLLDKGILEIDLSKFGSAMPGENERQIEQLFSDGKARQKAIFMDEADAILWDRSKAGADSMWMVSVIDKLLIEIGRYPYLCILATNREQMLDSALERRIIASVFVGKPEQPERLRLWKSKIPKQYPLKLSPIQYEALSEYQLTGAEIENTIIKETQLAILHDRLPTFESLCNVAKLQEK